MGKIKLKFVFFLILFSLAFSQIAGATIYEPGETLEPDCPPESVDCGVATFSLNNQLGSVQTLVTGNTGVDFSISSVGNIHTFNFPSASALARGLLTAADWLIFNGKQDALSSGVNIKTIGGASLLGSGDISVGGTGTVTNVSVVSANGISGSVSNATTTPAITLTLGAITPTTVNALTLAAQANGFTIAGGTSSKTLTIPLDASVSGTNTGDQTITLTGGVTGSGNGTFATTVVTNANLSGVITSVGNTTSLGSFSSANLLGALTDETGTGLAVFNNSPTFVDDITIGGAGVATGQIKLSGTTSGTMTLKTADVAGTYTLTLPTDDGTSNQFLQTDGNGVLTWASIPGGGDMLAVTYDPTNVGGDAFDMDNMTQGSTNYFVTSTDITNLSNLSGVNTGDQDLSGLVPYTGANADLVLGNNDFSMTNTSAGDVMLSLVGRDDPPALGSYDSPILRLTSYLGGGIDEFKGILPLPNFITSTNWDIQNIAGILKFTNGTATISVPSITGTLALISDIPDVSSYVPYTGASSDVDLGAQGITASFFDTNLLGIIDSSDTYYTNFQGGDQTALGSDITYTLPIDYPSSSGYVLSSTDAGVMSWVANGAGGSQTPWASDINASGYDLSSLSNLLFQETAAAPTGTGVGLYRDNSGDLNINVLTNKGLNIAVNGVDEYNFSSTGINFNSNNITNIASIDTISISATDLTFAGVGTITGTTTLALNSTGSNAVTVDSTINGAVNIGTGNTSKIINIGTGTGGNAINIGTDDTLTDLIEIGSALDLLILTGNSSSELILNGVVVDATEINRLNGKDATLVDVNDSVATAITGTGALNAGSIISGFGAIDVGANSITTTGAVFGDNFDRSTTGALTFGNTNATSVSICNSANCDTITLGNNADADTITIGDASDSTALNSANWSINTAGLVTTASDMAVNGGDITSTATTLNIDVGNTGSIVFRDGTNTLFTVADAGTVGTLTATGSIVTSNLGVDYADSDTNPTCGAGEYKIFADAGDFILKKCMNGVITDLDTTGASATTNMNSFTDTTTNSVVDADTTNYWDGTAPNITPTSASNEVLVMMTANITGTATGDTQISAQIMRHTSAITCQTTGTAVGGQVGTFQGFNAGSTTISAVFVDTPGTISNIRYALCSEADSEGAVGTVSRIDFTLYEINDNADLAEVYATNDSSISSGDIVSLDSTLESGVKKSEGLNDRQVIGIVSTKPALLIGGINDEGVSAVPVALSGRVPVKVVTENGAIEIGDYLSASSLPGVAMKSNGAGSVIGQAMSAYNAEGVGFVTAFIKNFEFGGGSILMGDISATEGLTTLVADIQNEIAHDPVAIIVQKISDGEQFLTNFVSARVTAIRGYFDEIFVKKVHTEQICVKKSDGNEVCVSGDQIDMLLQNAGISPVTIPIDDGGSGGGTEFPPIEIPPIGPRMPPTEQPISSSIETQ